jgi:CBS domain-containing membrane protein
MRVHELMTPDPITLMVDDSFDLAEKFMEFAHIRHLPVVDGERLIGLVTLRDLLEVSLKFLRDVPPREAHERKLTVMVSEIMRPEVRYVTPETDVRSAIEMMIDHKYGCLPVCDDERHLQGIVTEADFLKFTRRLLEQVDIA